jgi:hypothetical protein
LDRDGMAPLTAARNSSATSRPNHHRRTATGSSRSRNSISPRMAATVTA